MGVRVCVFSIILTCLDSELFHTECPLTECVCVFVCVGTRSELHTVPAHSWADTTQTQPSAQRPAQIRQTHGVAEEHPEREIWGSFQGECSSLTSLCWYHSNCYHDGCQTPLGFESNQSRLYKLFYLDKVIKLMETNHKPCDKSQGQNHY